MQNTRRSWWWGVIGFLWFFGIIVLYYISHKPLTPSLAIHLAMAAWRLLVGLAMISLAGGLGHRMFPGLNLHPLTTAALQAGLGMGVMALVVLLVGVLGRLYSWMLVFLLVLPGILLWRSVFAWWGQFRCLGELWLSSGRFGRSVAILLASILSSTLLVALAPPVHFDALMYHMVLPITYLRTGHVAYLPWLIMSGMPQTGEMLYTWAISLGGLPAAPVLGWFFNLLGALGLLGYLYHRLEARAAWVGVASLMAGFTLASSTSWGYVDWLGLFWGFGCIVSLDQWRQVGERRWVILAGLFAGLAVGTKYVSILLAGIGACVLAWHALRRCQRFFPEILCFCLAALVPVLPWLVKNWITTGSPVYPFFFAAGAMTPTRLAVYQGLPPWGNWWDVFLLPLRATYLGIDGADGYSASIGPLLLGLGALAWVGTRHLQPHNRVALENATAFTLLGWLVWAIGNQASGFLIQTRYYLFLFPAFAILAAMGFDGLARLQIPRLRLERILCALILLVLSFNLLEVGLDTLRRGAPQLLVGISSDEEYLTNNLGWFYPAMQGVQNLPSNSRVLLLFEPRGLYCQPKCTPDEILDRWRRDWVAYRRPEAILQAWRDEGFTHVLFYNAGAEFMRETGDIHHELAEWETLDAFLHILPDPVYYYGNAYTLYDIRRKP